MPEYKVEWCVVASRLAKLDCPSCRSSGNFEESTRREGQVHMLREKLRREAGFVWCREKVENLFYTDVNTITLQRKR